VIAAVPVTNESKNPRQRRDAPTPYLTLRELQQMAAKLQSDGAEGERVKWDGSDPGAYLIQSSVLDSIDDPPRRALAGRDVVISRNDYVHRWIDMRAEVRTDLLPLISTDAKSIIELGCGEAALGAAIKQRQRCRVVGVEIDPHAASIARKRIDEVYNGDVSHIVEILKEKFDCIVGSEIVEHVDDPWTLLAELHEIATPGGYLILSVPNIAHASIIGDLLKGRFDYTYIGLTCVGHVRFFTRRSIEEMLTLAGWKIVSVTPQRVPSAGADAIMRALESSKIDIAKDDLLATGFYVVAQNRS
jgi:2-polyprenyl-3-methyl-5-hydroxy-6-metoxy-1,4-benzoquinol methylase